MKDKFFLFFLIFFSIFYFWSCSHETSPTGPAVLENVLINPDPAIVKLDLLDDFEDGNLTDEMGGSWESHSDGEWCSPDGSTATNYFVAGQGGSINAVRFEYYIGSCTEYPGGNVGIHYSTPIDFGSYYNGIRFWIRGDGNDMRITFITTNVYDYCYYGYEIIGVPDKWTKYDIDFIDISQQDWGTPVDKTEAFKCITGIEFGTHNVTSGDTGWYEIDNIYLYLKE